MQQYLRRLGETSQQGLKEMRLLVHELRPLELEREGLVGALRQRLDAVERRVGVDVRLLFDDAIVLPAPLEEELYHIAQEALNNALKHARATSVTVRIAVDGDLAKLEVEDNGRGFDTNGTSDSGGMGLANMRERTKMLCGSFFLDSAPGKGTRVMINVATKGTLVNSSAHDVLEVSR